MSTTIDFLRHGEVAGGTYYRGSTNDPLTKQGWQQMKSAIGEQQWDHIISSPLRRCQDFAIYASKQNNTPLTTDSNWQEICFGEWEGRTVEQIHQSFPYALTRFYQDPINNTPAQGESMSDFLKRINQASENLLKLHCDKHVLVITHAGVIRSLFCLFLKLPMNNMFNIQIDHANFTRFQCFHDSPDNFVTLISHNLPTLIYT